MYKLYTWYKQLSTGFRGRQRDADAGQRDIPLPSASRDDMDAGSPCPEDGDFFYARPDAADTEEAQTSHQRADGAFWGDQVV